MNLKGISFFRVSCSLLSHQNCFHLSQQQEIEIVAIESSNVVGYVPLLTAWSSLKMSVAYSVSQAVNAVLKTTSDRTAPNCNDLTQLVEDLR